MAAFGHHGDPRRRHHSAGCGGWHALCRRAKGNCTLSVDARNGLKRGSDLARFGPGAKMSFTLAIVGRPNVGKSTLFNRLVGKRLALVDDQPGVTRDLREGAARLADLRFTVIDTAGLEEVTDDSLQGRMRRLTERAVDMADICLFMIDARVGITPTDLVFAEILRKRSAHVILAANKAEGAAADAGVIEAYSLGLGEPIRLSAEHGEGSERSLRAC